MTPLTISEIRHIEEMLEMAFGMSAQSRGETSNFGRGARAAEEETASEHLDHLILKRGYYYRPNRAGYTAEVVAAGRYTKSEAEQEALVEPWHMRAVPLSEFRVPSPDVVTYVGFLRALGFTVIPPKDMAI